MGENANKVCERRRGGEVQSSSILPTYGEDAHVQPTDAPPRFPACCQVLWITLTAQMSMSVLAMIKKDRIQMHYTHT